MGEPPGGRRNPAAFLRFWGPVARVRGEAGETGGWRTGARRKGRVKVLLGMIPPMTLFNKKRVISSLK